MIHKNRIIDRRITKMNTNLKKLEKFNLRIAFSMYSKIPMVQFEWKEEDMRYSMCFFPLVGIVIGLLSWCWWLFCQQFDIGKMCFAFVGIAIILLVTGGIHMDGYMDTIGCASFLWKPRKKTGILKDSHIGAFAVIMTVLYVLIAAGAYSEIKNYSVMASFCGAYFLSRIFSAIAVVSFPCAKRRNAVYVCRCGTGENSKEKPVCRVSVLRIMANFDGSKGRYYAAYMCFGSVWLLLL